MGGRVTIQASLNGLPQGTLTVGPLTISPNSDNLAETDNNIFPTGLFELTVPTWAVGCIIQPSPSNTSAIELGGVFISRTGPTLITFDDPPPAVLPFTTTVAMTTETTVTYF
jgi:hypothetical protein